MARARRNSRRARRATSASFRQHDLQIIPSICRNGPHYRSHGRRRGARATAAGLWRHTPLWYCNTTRAPHERALGVAYLRQCHAHALQLLDSLLTCSVYALSYHQSPARGARPGSGCLSGRWAARWLLCCTVAALCCSERLQLHFPRPFVLYPPGWSSRPLASSARPVVPTTGPPVIDLLTTVNSLTVVTLAILSPAKCAIPEFSPGLLFPLQRPHSTPTARRLVTAQQGALTRSLCPERGHLLLSATPTPNITLFGGIG
jgi:hypothetical protein